MRVEEADLYAPRSRQGPAFDTNLESAFEWKAPPKVIDYEAESESLEGPIVIQNHRTDFWFRNIRIKRLD